MTNQEIQHLDKIKRVQNQLRTAKGFSKIDLTKHLQRLKRELRVYRSFRGNTDNTTINA